MKSSTMGSSGLVFALVVGLAGVACEDKKDATPPAPSAAASASAAPKASASAAPSPSGSAAAADPEAAAKQAEQDEIVNNEVQAHHQHHHTGFAGFVLAAVETLGVGPDEETAIEAIRKEYRTKAKALHEANTALLQAVADGVAAGNIDKAKVDGAIAKSEAAATAARGATQELLTKLHGAIKPEERSALVDKVDAQWAAWREANEKATEGPKADKRLKRLAKELSLTKDQVDKAHAALEAEKPPKKPFDAAASETYIKAFDAAFVGETFDAKKLPPEGPESARIVAWGEERMVAFYTAIAPILTPDQRTTLATKLREREEKEKEKGKSAKP